MKLGRVFCGVSPQCVTVRGRGLVLSIVHLPPLTGDSPFMFTVLLIFFADTVTVEGPPISFSPFSSADCTMLSHFSFNDFIAVAFPDLARDLDIQI